MSSESQPNTPPIDEAVLRSRTKRKIGCLPIAVVSVVSMTVIAITAIFFWNMVASRRLKRSLEVLAAAGYPTSAAELEATYKPGDNNPGPLWVAAGQSLLQNVDQTMPWIGTEGETPPPPGEAWAKLPEARDYLDQRSDELQMLYEAAGYAGPARYDHSVSPSPLVQTHRQAVRVLSIAAYVHAHDGDIAAVARDIRTGLKVAHSLSDEPTLMAQLVGIACSDMMCRRLDELSALPFTNAQLSELQSTLREPDLRRAVRRSLNGELTSVLDAFNDARMTGGLRRHEDAAFFVETVTPLILSTEEGDWHSILDAAEQAENEANAVRLTPLRQMRYGLSAGALSALPRAVEAHARRAATYAVMEAVLASKRFQLVTGQLPESLEALTPQFLDEVPRDILSRDGQPLRCGRTAEGIRIHSVGVNRVDDGGSVEVGPKQVPLDIVFELDQR